MWKINPFTALLENNTKQGKLVKSKVLSSAIENIFGFTLDKERSIEKNIVYLDISLFKLKELDLEILEHVLFERLLLSNENIYEHAKDAQCSQENIFEARVIFYLFGCYNNNLQTEDVFLKISAHRLIMRNILTSLKQPDLYCSQNLLDQFYGVMKQLEASTEDFFIDVCNYILEDEDEMESMTEFYIQFLKLIHTDIANFYITTYDMTTFNILKMFSKNDYLASILLDYCQPKDISVGSEYSNTLLGALFNISVLPKTIHGEFEFFQEPLDQATNAATENLLHNNTENLTIFIHTLMLNLLKCNVTVKDRTLLWIGNCLRVNADRGKLWNTQTLEINSTASFQTVGDGFMINLLTVLIKFCQPFCMPGNQLKILQVDPTYCAINNEYCEAKGIHLLDMSKETCLLPFSDDLKQLVKSSGHTYNFISDCFYMAHKAFDLGFRVTVDKLVKLNQEISRIERAYNEAVEQSSGTNEVTNTIKARMKSEMQRYLSIKCALLEPTLLDMIFNMICASTLWFNQVAMNIDFIKNGQIQCTTLKEKEIIFNDNKETPDTLKCIPEFLVENIVCYLVFLRRFNPKLFEVQCYEYLETALTFILLYMGSSLRMKNPHLRARLAEALEAVLPFHKDDPPGLNSLSSYQKEMLFKSHVHRKEIVKSLLEVFVGIEMTGQSVQFEQKFNYRRPMYLVMDYLWELPEQQQSFQNLAEEAQSNMDAVVPPLFLKFINLLINDAVYLLDESLANMSKLRELQTSRENGEWETLSIQERAQNLGYLQHIGMIARFDNILGKDTIHTLVNLTSKIKIVFTHSTMVDRVAAMLNYFLLNLVGPNQKNFKVKHQKEYSFEPAVTVLNICKIYIQLKESDSFCLAVSQDGRSYSSQLFTYAEDVLVKIGGALLVGELREFANMVSTKAAEYQLNEEVISEAPEHFLDPIMSTLMLDPVILPSSRQTVDRTTIARHLLSDQTDPFNRSPLTLDQVIRDEELSEEIQKWIMKRKIKPSKKD